MSDWGWVLLLSGMLTAFVLLGVVWLQTYDSRWRARYTQMLEFREQQLVGMIADSVGLFRDGVDERTPPVVVVGQSALSARYYGNVLPDTRSKYHIQSGDHYTQLCQLARREAVIRMLESAQDAGFNAVCNVQIDATDMGHTFNRAQRAMVLITATGTAYRVL